MLGWRPPSSCSHVVLVFFWLAIATHGTGQSNLLTRQLDNTYTKISLTAEFFDRTNLKGGGAGHAGLGVIWFEISSGIRVSCRINDFTLKLFQFPWQEPQRQSDLVQYLNSITCSWSDNKEHLLIKDVNGNSAVIHLLSGKYPFLSADFSLKQPGDINQIPPSTSVMINSLKQCHYHSSIGQYDSWNLINNNFEAMDLIKTEVLSLYPDCHLAYTPIHTFMNHYSSSREWKSLLIDKISKSEKVNPMEKTFLLEAASDSLRLNTWDRHLTQSLYQDYQLSNKYRPRLYEAIVWRLQNGERNKVPFNQDNINHLKKSLTSILHNAQKDSISFPLNLYNNSFRLSLLLDDDTLTNEVYDLSVRKWPAKEAHEFVVLHWKTLSNRHQQLLLDKAASLQSQSGSSYVEKEAAAVILKKGS